MHELDGKIALVTGAGRGLGRMWLAGWPLVERAWRWSPAESVELHETAAAIERAGGRALVLPADVAQIEAVDTSAGTGQRPARTAANPGQRGRRVWAHRSRFAQSDPRRWIETLATNTIGPYLTCRAFVGAMIELRWGRIINFSSAASLHTPGPLEQRLRHEQGGSQPIHAPPGRRTGRQAA